MLGVVKVSLGNRLEGKARGKKERNALNAQVELYTDVDIAGHLDDLGELHALLGGGLEVVDAEDLEATLVDQLLGGFHVGALETGDDGDAEVHGLCNADEALSDGVAADDTTEDVDEDGGDLGVGGDEVESALDGLGGGSATDVEEVGGRTAVELDNVHGGHGKTGTVDEAANVTVKLDEVEAGLGGLDLVGVLLGGVAPLEDLLLSEVGVVVEAELGVHAQNLVVGGLGKGVDLDLGGVLLHEELVQLLDGVGTGVNALGAEAELLGDVLGHLVGDTNVDVDGGGDDGLGALLGDGLNVHTTLAGGDDDGRLSGAVHEDCEVELAAGELALDNVDGVADATTLAGLLGDELVADHLVGKDASLTGTEEGLACCSCAGYGCCMRRTSRQSSHHP